MKNLLTLILTFTILLLASITINAQSLYDRCDQCTNGYKLYYGVKHVLNNGEHLSYDRFQELAAEYAESVGIEYDESGSRNIEILHAIPCWTCNENSSIGIAQSQPQTFENDSDSVYRFSNIGLSKEDPMSSQEYFDTVGSIVEGISVDTIATITINTVTANPQKVETVDLGCDSCNITFISDLEDDRKWNDMSQIEKKRIAEAWRNFFWANRIELKAKGLYKFRYAYKYASKWRNKQHELKTLIPYFGNTNSKNARVQYDNYYDTYQVLVGESACTPIDLTIKKVSRGAISYGGQNKVKGKGFGRKAKSNCKAYSSK